MANEEQKTIDVAVKDGEITTDVSSGQSKVIWIVTIILFVLSMAATFWVYTQLQEYQLTIQNDERAQQANLATVQTEMNALPSLIASLRSEQDAFAKKLDALEQKQQFSSKELLAEWSIREVAFLLDIANQRAVLAKDVEGAISALTMADEKIESIGDYRLHPLRALIAEEQMALEGLAGIDISGMGIQLQTMANHVQNLRVIKGPQVVASEAAAQIDATKEASWQQAVNDIWQEIRSLVVIRHNDTEEMAVLVPEQRYFLYQNLKLQLESARLNLLQADQKGYEQSIETARVWLEQYFIGDERDAMLASLTSLQQTNIEIAIPDISGSLVWLKEYQQ